MTINTRTPKKTKKKRRSQQQEIRRQPQPTVITHTEATPAVILQKTSGDPNRMTRGDVMHLQRSLGNRAVGQLVSGPKSSGFGPVSRAPLQIQRRLWTKDTFKTATYEGFFTGRGKAVKAIEALLTEYHDDPFMPLDSKIQIVEEIQEHTNNWLADHEGDKSRANRMVGMKTFKTVVEAELKRLQDQKKKREDAGIPLDQGSRQSNLQNIKDKHEGDAKSMFQKLGWMLDMAVPTTGDKSKLEIEFKIPVSPSGNVYVGGHLTCEAERGGPKQLKARTELTFTVGGTIGIAQLQGELGGYIEAQAENSDKVMQLISYVMYRRFEESKVLPRKMSNFMWGGSTGVVGFRRAERWAAKLEKEVFGSLAYGTPEEKEKALETYVEMGGVGAVKGEFNVGIGKAKGSIKGTTGQRYDRESIEALKQGGLGSARKDFTFGQAQEHIGKSTHGLEIAGELAAGPFKGEAKVVWQWMTNKMRQLTALKDWSVEFGATGQLPMTQLVGSGVGPYIGEIVVMVIEIIRKAQEQASNASQNVGTGLSLAENATVAITQLTQVPQEAFKPGFKVEPDKAGFEGNVGLKLGFKIGMGGKAEFTLEYVKSAGVKAGVSDALSVFTASLEKAKRLLKLSYDPAAGWKVE